MSPDMQSEPIGDQGDTPSVVATTDEVAPVHEVVIPARALAGIGLAVAATWITILVIDRGRTVLALLVGAGAAALVLAPLVRRLERVVPRAAAVVGATLGGIVLTVAVIGVVAWDLDRQADDLSEDIQSAIEALPPGSAAAEVAAEIDLASTADDLLDGLAAEVVLGDDDPLAVAGRISKIVLVGVLAAFLVTQGTPLVDRALRSIRRASIREEVHRAMGSARRRGGAHVRRTVAVSVVHGAVAGVVAGALGMPGAISLAAWVALAVTVPILGGPLAWAPSPSSASSPIARRGLGGCARPSTSGRSSP
jgi:predicted PurR-regulated permease PerM